MQALSAPNALYWQCGRQVFARNLSSAVPAQYEGRCTKTARYFQFDACPTACTQKAEIIADGIPTPVCSFVLGAAGALYRTKREALCESPYCLYDFLLTRLAGSGGANRFRLAVLASDAYSRELCPVLDHCWFCAI